jgi:3-oxoacyl-[acyl-carrier protein] reductase
MSKRVLITGSSRGIGRSCSLRLAQEGWSVILHGSRPSDALETTRALIADFCVGAMIQPLHDLESGRTLWSKAIEEHGPIHALVNNAGIYQQHDFAGIEEEAFDALAARMMGINFLAPLALTREASKTFIENGGGRIVQVASRVGLKGEPGAALYAASKAALINLVKSLAAEQAHQKVHHFAIAPGWVDTAMARDGMEDRLPSIISGIPYGRMGAPEDCAHAVNWLLSGEADYMTGLVIDINGASYFR